MSGLSGLSDKGLSVQCACGNTATVTSSQHSSSQPPLCCWGDVTSDGAGVTARLTNISTQNFMEKTHW